MAEHSVDPNLSDAPAETSEASEQAQINKYLRSADWEERVRVARLQRAEVLAKGSRLVAEDKAPTRAHFKPDMAMQSFGDGCHGDFTDSGSFSGPEARLESERPEPQNLPAPRMREKSKALFAATDHDVFAIALQKESSVPAPLFSEVPLKKPKPSEEVESNEVATVVVSGPERTSTVGRATMSKPKSVLPGGYAGLAVGLGIGLIIGFIARDSWVTRHVTGSETADSPLPTADFNSGENGIDGRLAETTLPILLPTEDDPIAPLSVPILAVRVKRETTYDAPPSAAGDALAAPVISVAAPQSLSSIDSSEIPGPMTISASDTPAELGHVPGLVPQTRFTLSDHNSALFVAPTSVEVFASISGDGSLGEGRAESATTPVVPGVESSIKLASLQASLSPAPGDEAIPAIARSFPFATGGSYQIQIHMAAGQSDDAVRTQLRDLGLANSRRVPSDLGAAQTTVAFYVSEDSKVAETIARVYGGTLIDMSGFTPNPPAHTFDLYVKN